MSSPAAITLPTIFPAPPSVAGQLFRSLIPLGHKGDRLPDNFFQLDDHRIDPANLAAYQRLCRFDVSSTLPSTYVHVQAFPLAVAVMADREFPLGLLGLVHIHNQITQYRPVDSSEELSLSAWAVDLRAHPSGRQVDLHASARVGTELVWGGVSTYLQRESTTPPEGARKPRVAADPLVPSALWRLPTDLGRRYAAISGDRNPIHLSTLSAKAFGFPRAIAHGMYLHARALAAISTRLPPGYLVDVAFKTPAPLGSTVAFDGRRRDDRWSIQVSSARSGRPHLTAETTPLP